MHYTSTTKKAGSNAQLCSSYRRAIFSRRRLSFSSCLILESDRSALFAFKFFIASNVASSSFIFFSRSSFCLFSLVMLSLASCALRICRSLFCRRSSTSAGSRYIEQFSGVALPRLCPNWKHAPHRWRREAGFTSRSSGNDDEADDDDGTGATANGTGTSCCDGAASMTRDDVFEKGNTSSSFGTTFTLPDATGAGFCATCEGLAVASWAPE
mmetsp:Transcript_11801/g.34051  ORF Transcript_11801/g.34051 Transcript_11801/m.34051 type:complete len:212 (-) Transcript_11801:713-1348(-)